MDSGRWTERRRPIRGLRAWSWRSSRGWYSPGSSGLELAWNGWRGTSRRYSSRDPPQERGHDRLVVGQLGGGAAFYGRIELEERLPQLGRGDEEGIAGHGTDELVFGGSGGHYSSAVTKVDAARAFFAGTRAVLRSGTLFFAFAELAAVSLAGQLLDVPPRPIPRVVPPVLGPNRVPQPQAGDKAGDGAGEDEPHHDAGAHWLLPLSAFASSSS